MTEEVAEVQVEEEPWDPTVANELLVQALSAASMRADLNTLAVVLRMGNRPRDRGPGWVHASGIYNGCAREMALDVLGIKKRRTIVARTRRVFDNGTYMHLRYGVYFMLFPRPWGAWLSQRLDKWPIAGEADAVLYHPQIGKEVIELKSINLLEFRELYAPKPEHYAQINTYMGMSGIQHGHVIYENKNNQEFKLFPVEFNVMAWREAHAKALQVAAGILERQLPEKCMGCSDPACDELVVTDEVLEVIEGVRGSEVAGA